MASHCHFKELKELWEFTAARAFTTACALAQTGDWLAGLGQSACSFGVGMETPVFQYDEMVVAITVDLDGMYVCGLAEIVVERL